MASKGLTVVVAGSGANKQDHPKDYHGHRQGDDTITHWPYPSYKGNEEMRTGVVAQSRFLRCTWPPRPVSDLETRREEHLFATYPNTSGRKIRCCHQYVSG